MKDFSGSDGYVHQTVVRHQGIVIVFASKRDADDHPQIYYRSLNPRPDVPEDDDNWSDLTKLEFPKLLRPVGMSLVTRELEKAPEQENAVFRVLSDGRYIYTFRQSVNGTLLVDRYVFDQASLTLNPNYEARFQRSRKKDIPSGRKDSLGYQDMVNDPFPEPTLEIDLTHEINNGNFAVLLLPTDVPGQTRWLLIAGNGTEKQLDLFYIDRTSDGLFDMDEKEEINLTLQTQDEKDGLEINSLDAITYAQQENVKDESGRTRKLKRSMRMMLAGRVNKMVGGSHQKTDPCPILILDFAVTRDGKLTRVPDEGTLHLPDVNLDSDQRSLPSLLVDVNGTELRGGMLSLLSGTTPFLLDGSDGLVHLYYGNQIDEQFMVTQFDTTVARSKIELVLLPEERTAQLAAIRPGTDLNDSTLQITPGADDDHCKVQITSHGGDTQEAWSEVPRRLDQFAAVLNGDTTTDENDARLASGSMVAYDTAQNRKFTSKRPAYLVYDIPAGIGSVRLETLQPVIQDQSGVIIEIARGTRTDFCKVTLKLKLDETLPGGVTETWSDVPRDVDDFILVLSGMFSSDSKDPQVKDGSKILYDIQKKAKSSDTNVDLNSGSNLFRFHNRGASGKLADQKITNRTFDFNGSQLFGVVTDTSLEDAVLTKVNDIEQPAPVTEQGADAQWIPEPLGYMLDFNGNNFVKITTGILSNQDFRGDLALEAWIQPATVNAEGLRRILHFNSDTGDTNFFLGLKEIKGQDSKFYFLPFAASQDVPVLAKDEEQNRIPPGEWSHLAAVFDAANALKLDGEGYVDCGNAEELGPVEALTVEAWVKPDASKEGLIAAKWGKNEADQSWMLFIDNQNPCFQVYDGENKKTWLVASNTKLDASDRHLAGIFDVTPRKEVALSLNPNLKKDVDPDFADHVIIESTGLAGANPVHSIEAWIWLDEYPGKTAWILDLGTGNNPGDHHWLLGKDGFTALGVHTTGPQFRPKLNVKEWTHIAMVYDGKYLTCYINGQQFEESRPAQFSFTAQSMVIGRAPTLLDSDGNVTKVDPVNWQTYWNGKINNLRVWKKALSAVEVGDSMLKTSNDVTGADGLVGHWPFDKTDRATGRLTNKVTGKDALKFGYPKFDDVDLGSYRMELYVDGQLEADILYMYYQGKLEDSDDNKHIKWLSFPVPENDAEIDLRKAGPPDKIKEDHKDVTTAVIQHSNTNVCIGSAPGVDIPQSFVGQIDEVRIWNTRRTGGQINYFKKQPMQQSDKNSQRGLIAWWTFDEGQGTMAEDSKGSSHGRLIHNDQNKLKNNEMWIPTTRNAGWKLYRDGKSLEFEDPVEGRKDLLEKTLAGYGDKDQFYMGIKVNNGQYHYAYVGLLDDVRIWQAVRRPEQITDNMYRELDGGEEKLIAYWRMDEGQGGQIGDSTGNGHHGKFLPTYEPTWKRSLAPIGNESPRVRNAIQGLSRKLNIPVWGRPAVAEYGDMQFDADGNLFGVMKRCYIYHDTSKLKLNSGFKIGDLELNFIGQVQTAPTLIGYIEGPPPVPSENLTVNDPRTDDYVGNTSITLTEASDSTQIYSASRDTGLDTSVDLKFGIYSTAKTTVGVGVQTEVLNVEHKGGIHAVFEHTQSWLMGSQISSTISRTLSNTLSMGGGWEEKIDHDHNGGLRYLNKDIGRRYVPNNMGYALVKSATADLFALRLKRDGSVVAYQILPNPDIPEDWNIIMFPLNPKYIKNGTLDGMVGLVPDPDYPNAKDGDRGSYFKPLEAYALKTRVDRQAKQIEGYYDRYNARTKTGYLTIGTDGNPLEMNIPTDTKLGYDWANKQAKRNLVNTYVWTADGGFFSEEQQFSTTRQESKGGAYHFLGQVGLSMNLQYTTASIGIFFEMDALLGGHINTTLSQTKEEKAGYGISVNVVGEGFLNRWVGDPERNSGHFTSEPCPGKVDGYRFMTFYMTPEYENFKKFFDQVVDPNWLYERGPYAGQYLPNARAMREAKNNANEVWRVLHRVTFVSRIPPKIEEKPLESTPPPVRRPDNVEANMALIDEIEYTFDTLYPDENPAEAGLAKLGDAVDKWLEQVKEKTWGKDLDLVELTRKKKEFQNSKPPDDPERKHVEQLVTYRQELRQDIISYLKDYYEMVPDNFEGRKQSEKKAPVTSPVAGPASYISSPSSGSTVGRGMMVIRGAVQYNREDSGQKYRLEILGGRATNWKLVDRGTAPVKAGGVLGRLDTKKLSPGDYRLRLALEGEAWTYTVQFRVGARKS